MAQNTVLDFVTYSRLILPILEAPQNWSLVQSNDDTLDLGNCGQLVDGASQLYLTTVAMAHLLGTPMEFMRYAKMWDNPGGGQPVVPPQAALAIFMLSFNGGPLDHSQRLHVDAALSILTGEYYQAMLEQRMDSDRMKILWRVVTTYGGMLIPVIGNGDEILSDLQQKQLPWEQMRRFVDPLLGSRQQSVLVQAQHGTYIMLSDVDNGVKCAHFKPVHSVDLRHCMNPPRCVYFTVDRIDMADYASFTDAVCDYMLLLLIHGSVEDGGVCRVPYITHHTQLVETRNVHDHLMTLTRGSRVTVRLKNTRAALLFDRLVLFTHKRDWLMVIDGMWRGYGKNDQHLFDLLRSFADVKGLDVLLFSSYVLGALQDPATDGNVTKKYLATRAQEMKDNGDVVHRAAKLIRDMKAVAIKTIVDGACGAIQAAVLEIWLGLSIEGMVQDPELVDTVKSGMCGFPDPRQIMLANGELSETKVTGEVHTVLDAMKQALTTNSDVFDKCKAVFRAILPDAMIGTAQVVNATVTQQVITKTVFGG